MIVLTTLLSRFTNSSKLSSKFSFNSGWAVEREEVDVDDPGKGDDSATIDLMPEIVGIE